MKRSYTEQVLKESISLYLIIHEETNINLTNFILKVYVESLYFHELSFIEINNNFIMY